MNRWLLIGSLAGLLIASTGCLHHNTRGCGSGGCSTGACGQSDCGCNSGGCNGVGCNSGGCNSGGCNSGACGGQGSCGSCNQCGALGAIGSACGLCGCRGRVGCEAGPLGWQQGGLHYSSYLQPGACGHNAGQALANRPFNPGLPSAQVAYPYYTVRGPRDFLLDNPPTIGR